MAYKQPSGGSTFKMMGSSPAKQTKFPNSPGAKKRKTLKEIKTQLTQDQIEDQAAVSTNIKMPKVMKDGPKNRVHMKDPKTGKTVEIKDWQPKPFKQLKEEYMRTPQEKAFYESSESKDYEPEPSGKYRGIGSYSKNKKTGDVVTKGIAGSKPKKKVATSEKVGPVESPKAIKAKEAASDKAKKGEGNIFTATKEQRDATDKAYAAEEDAKSYVKKK